MDNRYDEMFKAGNEAQLEQMVKNEHKEGYDKIDINYAIDKIVDKADELWVRMRVKENNYVEIKTSAAHIANYAQMIILKCNKEIKNES